MSMRMIRTISITALLLVSALFAALTPWGASLGIQAASQAAPAAVPEYQVFDNGVTQLGDTASQSFGEAFGGCSTVTPLTGAQEVPPNGSTATGSGTVTLSPAQDMITVDLNWAGLTTN